MAKPTLQSLTSNVQKLEKLNEQMGEHLNAAIEEKDREIAKLKDKMDAVYRENQKLKRVDNYSHACWLEEKDRAEKLQKELNNYESKQHEQIRKLEKTIVHMCIEKAVEK